MTSLEHLARTIARARHGTDAMWANYMGAADAARADVTYWIESMLAKQADRAAWRDLERTLKRREMTEAPETSAKIVSGWQIVGPEEKDALVLKLMEMVRSLEAELRREREHTGGAAATYYLGNLVLCHPDMPPHIWDGEKMEKIEWTK